MIPRYVRESIIDLVGTGARNSTFSSCPMELCHDISPKLEAGSAGVI